MPTITNGNGNQIQPIMEQNAKQGGKMHRQLIAGIIKELERCE